MILEPVVEKTKSRLPCIWESGGGFRNTGIAVIVANKDGNPKKLLFVRRGGHLANREHALFILEEGDVVIQVERRREEYEIRVFRFTEEKLKEIMNYRQGEWESKEGEEWKKYEKAIYAAVDKSNCYHCREPHFMSD
jgi:mRNA degradation ribonuclease J1/J2